MDSKVVKNASWIVGCKVIQSILAFLISMLTARYLGPSNFGLINYAQSVALFLIPIMQLGFNCILVRELINKPQDEGKTLGTCICMSFISSLICIIIIFIFCTVVNPNDNATLKVCLLYGISLIFQSLELIQYWYQAKFMAKYTSIVSLIAYAVVSAYKIFLLATGKNVYWFAVSYAIDYMLISLTLLILYRKLGGKRLKLSKCKIKPLFNAGKYYIISALMITVFLQTDRVMLKIMIGDSATGIYSAAANCTSIAAFVFAAINDSMRPYIIETKKNGNDQLYSQSVIQLYSIVLFIAFFYAGGLLILANPIIKVIYGSQYLEAVPVLRILSLYTFFAYYGGAKDVWVLAEEKQKYLLILNGTGALCNIILNYFLIRKIGIIGAALASFLTNFIVNIVMMWIVRELRPNNKLLVEAIRPNNILKVLANFNIMKTLLRR